MANWGWVALAIAMAAGSCRADDKHVRLVSLEWQPYAGAALPEQGASAVVVRAAFQAMGYAVDIDFYPWARAVRLAEGDNEYDGIFPMYYSTERERRLDCSSSIGHGPLGFAERAAAPVTWSTLDDLRAHRIGVVRDYVNTDAFDRLVAAGRIDVDTVSSDTQNLQKLAHGRIDLAVIDRNVFDYLSRSSLLRDVGESAAPVAKNGKEAAAGDATLRFNAHLLEDKVLYACFKRNAADARLAAVFRAGLRKIDVDAVVAGYMKRLDGRAVPARISR